MSDHALFADTEDNILMKVCSFCSMDWLHNMKWISMHNIYIGQLIRLGNFTNHIYETLDAYVQHIETLRNRQKNIDIWSMIRNEIAPDGK